MNAEVEALATVRENEAGIAELAVEAMKVVHPGKGSFEYCASGFGLRWRSDIELPGFDPEARRPCDGNDYVQVCRVESFRPRETLRIVNQGQIYADGFRLGWGNEVQFDIFDGERIEYQPGAGWRGALPAAFYSTVAALTLAWRGLIPFHACAVEIGGHGIMIMGPSESGKSSLTAGLIGLGGRLVADDLTAVRPRAGGEAIDIFRGRPAMRQHRDTAARIDAEPASAVPDDPREKWQVRPRARTPLLMLPLSGILVLTGDTLELHASAKLALLASHLFRPRWLGALPNNALRRRGLLAITAIVPLTTFPKVTLFEARDQEARAEHALTQIHTLIEATPAAPHSS